LAPIVVDQITDRFYVIEKGRVIDELRRDELASQRDQLHKSLGL
jgi:ABC-type branched-subunit amino acid transport system ATPase component